MNFLDSNNKKSNKGNCDESNKMVINISNKKKKIIANPCNLKI